MDVLAYNREAWNRQVEKGNRWTLPVSPEEIAAARAGEWSIVLTPTIPVPREWFPENFQGVKILCLASGGGQQGPILAATGAEVTILDNSPRQLERDRLVAERENLHLTTVEGDMADLHMFADESFDLIFHPVSNVFAPEVLPVWREAYRVLRRGGSLLAGFDNPVIYIFDLDKLDNGEFEVRHKLPYSDLNSLSETALQQLKEQGLPLEFSHTLDEQIGGQLKAGFHLTGFYEDIDPSSPLSQYTPIYIATSARKP
jgi:SAM-dependent methyltransferase